MRFTIPQIDGPDLLLEIVPDSPTVFLGANGSGKTRLGRHLELQQMHATHRIPAQKSLTIGGNIAIGNSADALNHLHYGHPQHTHMQKGGMRDPTQFITDYDILLRALFSIHTDACIKYQQDSRAGAPHSCPETVLNILNDIWNQVLPHRRLEFKAGTSNVQATNSVGETQNSYNATALSDGEKVILYLIGQVLIAPNDTSLIIDEPELHVHKSVLKRLWDILEAQRRDCGFCYITHDLDFAASRIGATKFILKADPSAIHWAKQTVRVCSYQLGNAGRICNQDLVNMRR